MNLVKLCRSRAAHTPLPTTRLPATPQVGSTAMLGSWDPARSVPLRRSPWWYGFRAELPYGTGGEFSFKVSNSDSMMSPAHVWRLAIQYGMSPAHVRGSW